jgi:hypothetical protein
VSGIFYPILLIAVTDKRRMVLGGFFENGGLGIAHPNIVAAIDQFAVAAAMNGLIGFPERGFIVDENGVAAFSGAPQVGTAAGGVDAGIARANRWFAIDGDIP